jgi:hypothetical protein
MYYYRETKETYKMTNASKELKPVETNLNPFSSGGNQVTKAPTGNALMSAEMQRQIAEIQAQFMMAIHRPRNPEYSVDKMLIECQRPSLAEHAIYSFARGGTNITGLSIRALEMIARNWGNIKYGFRCLERSNGSSLLQAYAYDIENNVPVERIFEVKHVRDTKSKGKTPITDERDIYELEANQAQRRVRACLEALMPADVLDLCENALRRTLEAKADTSPEGIKKMLEIFANFNINQKMLEARIQRKIESITAAQMVGLRSVYNSLKDGMSSPESWFDISLQDQAKEEKSAAPDQEKETTLDSIKAEEAGKKKEEKKPYEKVTDCAKCGGRGLVEWADSETGETGTEPCECQKK